MENTMEPRLPTPKEAELIKYVADLAANGITQHSAEWFAARSTVIGGSSIATIQQINPYNSIRNLVSERIGLSKFVANIRPQWGNLFEEVIKRVVELMLQCKVYGEDLYVPGPPGTAYSPDGLAAVDADLIAEHTGYHTWPRERSLTVLMEFKCPYSRIPKTTMPPYYVPQVKMGLDILRLPTHALFVEGVFRRCSYDVCRADNTEHDQELAPVRLICQPVVAFGCIGMYCDKTAPIAAQIAGHYGEVGGPDNNWMCNDLGVLPKKHFIDLMHAFDAKHVRPFYGAINETKQTVAEFRAECKAEGYTALGIIPWKLFTIKYHLVEREHNDYLGPWMDEINKVIEIIKKCNAATDSAERAKIYNSYFPSLPSEFSDGL